MLIKLKKLSNHLASIGLTDEAKIIEKLSMDFVHREYNVRNASSKQNVFMHIGGPSGSGKSTLMEKIMKLHPEIVCKDLDEFDEDASESLGLHVGWKQNSYTDDLALSHFKEKQRLLDNFISAHHGDKIILVGIHSEGDFSLNFHPQHKILLNTSPTESLKRRIERDKSLGSQWAFWDDQDSINSELKESKKIISELKSENYTPLSSEDILNLLDDSLDKTAAYNSPRVGKKRWSIKYKKKINCSNPKGFSQKQYCRRKSDGGKYNKP